MKKLMKRIFVLFAIVLIAIGTNVGCSSQSTPRNPATEAQIREYLRASGRADEFRANWIAAVDKNRSIGAPYWPESFWQAIKDQMQKADLDPMFIAFYQQAVSQELMQEVLDDCHEHGCKYFHWSMARIKLAAAGTAHQKEMDKLRLDETYAVISKVYAVYKPQIEITRARYMAEHPDWKDTY